MDGLSYKQASKFLDAATMGIKKGDVEALLVSDDRNGWIDQQINLSYTNHVSQTLVQQQQRGQTTLTQEMRVCAWFDLALQDDAQLRQRVAFALSQILVVGDRDAQLAPYPLELANYYDILTTYAFSDYKTLLYHVTRSPIMGHYLTMVGNLPKSQTGVNPDQNYAREIMQLFTIGLNKLNPDGTLYLDLEGNPEANYDDADVEDMARIFTGWFMSNSSMNAPMEANNSYHDMESKKVLGESFPAGVGAEQELDHVLEVLVKHPNTAPNISTLLIKRFVTSNPTPAYVGRVSSVFKQTDGDLAAVIKAVLLDDEVNAEGSLFRAKLREPILAMTYLYRALDSKPGAGATITPNAMLYQDTFGQYPLGSPSVFNFYSPDYLPMGGLGEQGLTAPELEIIDWNQTVKMSNIAWKLVTDNGYKTSSNSSGELYPDVSDFVSASGDYSQLINLIANRFFGGEVPADLAPRFEGLWNAKSDNNKPYSVSAMLYFAFISPNFMVQE
ncbi:DUF1800 family protein [Vibrio sp. CyArs1]|uniref:DUF1800 domain-containing protein n=1 Tax=Vibrio sp. CyArs1 TaxID=2682577 RepID=UPI001F07096E|nr:DUF1800 family protein [Vibrio sp. CyArs1]